MTICGVNQYLEHRLMRLERSVDDEDDCKTPLILTTLDGDLAVPDRWTYPAFSRPDIKVLRVILSKGGN